MSAYWITNASLLHSGEGNVWFIVLISIFILDVMWLFHCVWTLIYWRNLDLLTNTRNNSASFISIMRLQIRICISVIQNVIHDDVIKWKHFPRYWPFVREIHRSPVNSPHKGQWRGALMFSLIYTQINGWVNNGEVGDLRRHRAHYDVTVMDVLIKPNASKSNRDTFKSLI